MWLRGVNEDVPGVYMGRGVYLDGVEEDEGCDVGVTRCVHGAWVYTRMAW